MSEFERDLIVLEDSPVIDTEIRYDGKEIMVGLTWSNTLIRLFRIGDGEYDHLVVEIDEDFVAVKADNSFLETLINLNYPIRIDPCLDTESIEAVALFKAVISEEKNEF